MFKQYILWWHSFYKVFYISKILISRLFALTLIGLILSTNVYAHNKVVVVPLLGDDVLVEMPAELTPTTPIAKIAPGDSDYIFSFNFNGSTFFLATVTDKITGLIWQRLDDNITRTWDEAWDYCANLELSSLDDWRLPTVKELHSIVDYGNTVAPFINQAAFSNTNSSTYWSATGSASRSIIARVVGFGNNIANSSAKTSEWYVRCVR